MKIGELATRADCDVQTIRYYEREALLEAPSRDASGYRRYDDQHLVRLQFIRHCRSLDIPLGEVRQLLEYALTPNLSCGDVDELLDKHVARVRQQTAFLQALERQLLALRGRCRGRRPADSCAILQAFMSAPSDHVCACHPPRRGNTTRARQRR
ncbi:MAG: Cd(II)/Pb(II)-responsive transcriptional regulator, partial [Pseudomonadota bacterium]|nr:Cd(II)/Pb(II)-responsive transcriptional regulator [Pseudomonadota bacterium]